MSIDLLSALLPDPLSRDDARHVCSCGALVEGWRHPSGRWLRCACPTCQSRAEREREAAEVDAAIVASGIPERYRAMSGEVEHEPDDWQGIEWRRTLRREAPQQIGRDEGNAEAVDALQVWDPRAGGGSCFLHGPAGSGKTMLVAVAALRLLREPVRLEPVRGHEAGPGALVRRTGGVSVVFTSEAELLARVRRRRQGLTDVVAEAHPLDAPKGCQVLVLDELGHEDEGRRSTSAITSADVIEEVVDTRYRSGNRPILATSNLTLARLKRQLGERTVSRLEEMCAGRVWAVTTQWRNP